MRKILLSILTITFTVLFIGVLVACGSTTQHGFSIELVDKNATFEFYVGEIDWESISFYLYDEEDNLVDAYSVTESMVNKADLSKLTTKGTKTVEINFQGAKMYVTLKLNEKEVVPTYTLKFDAGDGTFNVDGTVSPGSNIKIVETARLEAITEPKRTGYKFEGWYEDALGTGTRLETPYTPKRDITFYAKWSDALKYSLQYENFKDGESQGVISTEYNIENNTEITLLTPQNYSDRVFIGYEIWNMDELYSPETSTILKVEDNIDVYTWNITFNTNVRILYETKMVNISFFSTAWEEGAVVNGITITAGFYKTQVPYGTNLVKDIAPVPVLPELPGHTGFWYDLSTGQAPVYGKITTDLDIRSQYDILSVTMSFYDENNVENKEMARVVDYGDYIDNEPRVPNKDGHTGYWYVINDGYDSSVPNGQLVQISLLDLKMVKDIKVFAKYFPNDYEVSFIYRLEGMSEDCIETFKYKYDTFIDNPVDLTLDKEIDGIVYKGYDPKYYKINWKTGNNLVSFDSPIQVKGNIKYTASTELKPYAIDFRLPELFSNRGFDFTNTTIMVKPGEKVTPPTIIEEGYEVKGWYYIAPADVYDATLIYQAGEYVFFNGTYYRSLVDNNTVEPCNILTNEVNGGWMKASNRKSYSLDDIPYGIQVDDFHEYNEDPFLDRAFYAEIETKKFDVIFNNLVISGTNGSYTYNYSPVATLSIDYDSLIDSSLIPTSLTVPTYPDGMVGQFVFEGWYTESEFVTLQIDFDEFKVKSEIHLYAKWSDDLRGTDGLLFNPNFDDDGVTVKNYTVVGLNTKIAEFSHLTLRIPNLFEGKPVVAIEDNAFDYFDKTLYVDTIIIPENIVSIGHNAFAGCYSVQNIDITANSNFIFEDGVLYSADKTIIYYVASNSKDWANKTQFIIPNSTTEIIGGAFANISTLETVTIEGLTFENGSYNSNGNLQKVGSYAFAGCYALKSIMIPNSLTEIGAFAFKDNYSLNSVVIDNTSSGLFLVGKGAFENAYNALRENGDYLTIANVLIKYIGDSEEVTLLDSIISIADGAFDRNSTDEVASNYVIKKLTISSTSDLKYIGHEVFLSCSSLASINIMSVNKPMVESDSFSGVALSCKLYVNSSLMDEYLNDKNYNFFDNDSIIGA